MERCDAGCKGLWQTTQQKVLRFGVACGGGVHRTCSWCITCECDARSISCGLGPDLLGEWYCHSMGWERPGKWQIGRGWGVKFKKSVPDRDEIPKWSYQVGSWMCAPRAESKARAGVNHRTG